MVAPGRLDGSSVVPGRREYGPAALGREVRWGERFQVSLGDWGTKRGDARKNVEFEEPVCILVALTCQHRVSERLEKGMSRR